MTDSIHANCRFRKRTVYRNQKGDLISYGKCLRDNKSCREWDMYGYDCYEPIYKEG